MPGRPQIAEVGDAHDNLSRGEGPDLLRTASTLFYQRGVRAVGVDLVVEEAGVAKTSLYRHFRTKDDLIAAFLQREDEDFWSKWSRVTELRKANPVAELEAHLDWIAERGWDGQIIADARNSTSQRNFRTQTIPPAKSPQLTSRNSEGASRGSPSDCA